MLKKNRFFCLLVLFLSFITGCNSTKKVTKNASPMAIFSMSSNFSIKWHDDGFNKDENIKKGKFEIKIDKTYEDILEELKNKN